MAALKGVKTIDMKNGEITKVTYEGAEYERVEGDAKVGDLFLPRKGFHDMTAGSFYEIEEVDPDGDAYFFDDSGWSAVICSDDYFPFRKKHVRINVGDYAKVIDCAEGWKVAQGDFVKVLIDDKKYRPFQCKVQNGEFVGETVWMHESELVLATEAEVAEAKAKLVPKFSVGDYAKVGGDTHHRDIVGGAIVKITNLADEDGDLRFELVGDDDYDYAKPSSLEKVSAEEAKWAKIGRKVGEYKVGDIVSYADTNWFGNSGIGEVSEGQLLSYQVRIAATDRGGFKNEYYLNKGRVTLITPVEARFDRS
ncbi:hypothetical protein KLEB271_gp58 [Bacillus phage vB_BauS_KLEB27-1]|nr:hypothetical protein KLEB271_gp58 [Bacillus phage vB_BauS_KLEB27-1]